MDAIFMKSEQERRVKDLVIKILSSEWPLTTNTLYVKITAKYHVKVSYQAVHKALHELARQHVVRKEDKGFSLNLDWIDGLAAFSNREKGNYLKRQPRFLPGMKQFTEEGATQTFVFDTLAHAEEYRKRLQMQYFSLANAVPYVSQVSHLKSPIFYAERSSQVLHSANSSSRPCYLLVRGRTPIDEWCADFYRNSHIKIKVGVDCATTCDTMVIKDLIVQTYIPKDITRYLEHVYGHATTVPLTTIPQLYENIYRKKSKIRVVVLRNPEIAERFRRETIEYFNHITAFSLDGVLVEAGVLTRFATFLAKRSLITTNGARRVERAVKKGGSWPALLACGRALKGVRTADLASACAAFASSAWLAPLPQSRELVAALQQHGTTLAVSDVPTELAAACAKALGCDDGRGVRLATDDGAYTGSLETTENVAERFTRFVQDNGIRSDGSFAFGSANDDVGLLESAQIPVIVEPERVLHTIAKQRRWAVVVRNEHMLGRVRTILKKQWNTSER